MSTTSNQDRNFRDEMIGTDLLENAIDWIKSNLTPEEVFDQKTLEIWAADNDYVQIEDL